MRNLTVPILALVLFLACSQPAFAAKGSCGQPASNGATPLASDCLYMLRAALGVGSCNPTCICDLNASGGNPTASDALSCLKTSLGVPGLLDCPCGALATDGDDFDDDTKDTTRWDDDALTGDGSLIEAGTHLEYRCSGGTSFDEAERPWIKSELPYDSDWEAQIDLHNLTTTASEDEVGSFGIQIVSPDSPNDYIFAELIASRLTGPSQSNSFYAELGFDFGDYAFVDTGNTNLTAGAVRLVFDAATKVVTLFYDYPGAGYQWLQYGSFGIAGSGGSDGNGDWGLSAGDRLSVSAYGYSAHMEIAPAELYGDNFSVTGAVLP